jgi:hypothetical protein
MLQDSANWRKDDPNLIALGKVVDLNLIARTPSSIEIDSFWSSEWTQDTSKGALSFLVPYASFVINHPWAFLNARTETFLATNRIPVIHASSNWIAQVKNPFLSDPRKYFPPHPIYNFEEKNFLSSSNSWDLRRSMILGLLWVNSSGTPLPGHLVFWNVFLGLTLTFFSLILAISKKQKLYAMVASSLLGFALMAFMFAPAAYFMYYFPVILVGSILGIFQVLELLVKRSSRTRLGHA